MKKTHCRNNQVLIVNPLSLSIDVIYSLSLNYIYSHYSHIYSGVNICTHTQHIDIYNINIQLIKTIHKSVDQKFPMTYNFKFIPPPNS